jgi:hypothetical protein
MTTVANGGQISNSSPVESASGHKPAIVVQLVMSTGRVRSRTAEIAAAPPEAPPSSERRCMRSTSRIAGFTVNPSSAMTPTSA